MLIIEATKENIDVVEVDLPTDKCLKGIYFDGTIALNNNLISCEKEKCCVLAEELGHYYKTSGNILDQSKTNNVKQEKLARNWAYEKLVPLDKFIEAFKKGIHNRHELAEYLDVMEEFLEEALIHYREKYGIYVKHENYYIYFDIFGVLAIIEEI